MRNKADPRVRPIQIIEVINEHYARVACDGGRIDTVSTKDLAPAGESGPELNDTTTPSEPNLDTTNSPEEREQPTTTNDNHREQGVYPEQQTRSRDEDKHEAQASSPEAENTTITDRGIGVGRPVRQRKSPQYLKDYQTS